MRVIIFSWCVAIFNIGLVWGNVLFVIFVTHNYFFLLAMALPWSLIMFSAYISMRGRAR